MGAVVVIDPGHGGPDPGTTAGGMVEAEEQLALALMVRDRLRDQYPALQVLLTRETAAAVTGEPKPGMTSHAWLVQELQARCDMANRWPDALLVSLHHDYSVDPQAQGGTLYVYGPQSWIPAIGPQGEIQHAAPRSYAAAERMLPIFRAALAGQGITCNGIRAGDFQVLRNTDHRAVLVEGFFASHAGDARQVKAAGFRAAMADAYVTMILAALELTAPADPLAPGQVEVRLPGGAVVVGKLVEGHTVVPLRDLVAGLGYTLAWQSQPPVATVIAP